MLEAGRPQENRRDFELSRFSGMPSFGAECTGSSEFPHTYQISAYNLARIYEFARLSSLSSNFPNAASLHN
jgi:hypothetical protein